MSAYIFYKGQIAEGLLDAKIKIGTCNDRHHIHNGRSVLQIMKLRGDTVYTQCLHCTKYADQLQEIHQFRLDNPDKFPNVKRN